MKSENGPGRVFDRWARDHRASGMERGHWPVVRQAFELIPGMNGNYLEIGIGNGYSLHHMAKNQFRSGKCFGIDIAPGMVDVTRNRLRDLPNVTVEQGDFMEWMPPAGTEFSLIFSMEVFYYFPSIQKGIDKAFSLLRPGGQLWIMVDYYRENAPSHSWPAELDTPMQLWSADEYVEGMSKAGFTGVTRNTFFHPEETSAIKEPTLCISGVRALKD